MRNRLPSPLGRGISHLLQGGDDGDAAPARHSFFHPARLRFATAVYLRQSTCKPVQQHPRRNNASAESGLGWRAAAADCRLMQPQAQPLGTMPVYWVPSRRRQFVLQAASRALALQSQAAAQCGHCRSQHVRGGQLSLVARFGGPTCAAAAAARSALPLPCAWFPIPVWLNQEHAAVPAGGDPNPGL